MECGNQYGAGEEWLTGGQRRSEAKNGRGMGGRAAYKRAPHNVRGLLVSCTAPRLAAGVCSGWRERHGKGYTSCLARHP